MSLPLLCCLKIFAVEFVSSLSGFVRVVEKLSEEILPDLRGDPWLSCALLLLMFWKRPYLFSMVHIQDVFLMPSVQTYVYLTNTFFFVSPSVFSYIPIILLFCFEWLSSKMLSVIMHCYSLQSHLVKERL